MNYIKDYKTIPITELTSNDIIIAIHPKPNQTSCGPNYRLIAKYSTQVELIDDWYNKHHLFDNNITVDIQLTEQEKHTRDFDKAKEIAQAMEHELYDAGDAIHEMYNGWIDCNPYDMAKVVKEMDITIIGWFWLYSNIINKTYDLDIGIVAEYSDGDRIWCHANSKWFKDWKTYYPELYS